MVLVATADTNLATWSALVSQIGFAVEDHASTGRVVAFLMILLVVYLGELGRYFRKGFWMSFQTRMVYASSRIVYYLDPLQILRKHDVHLLALWIHFQL